MSRTRTAGPPLRHAAVIKPPLPAGMSRHERERRIAAVKAALVRARLRVPRRSV